MAQGGDHQERQVNDTHRVLRQRLMCLGALAVGGVGIVVWRRLLVPTVGGAMGGVLDLVLVMSVSSFVGSPSPFGSSTRVSTQSSSSFSSSASTSIAQPPPSCQRFIMPR